jgi:hypothetical protein
MRHFYQYDETMMFSGYVSGDKPPDHPRQIELAERIEICGFVYKPDDQHATSENGVIIDLNPYLMENHVRIEQERFDQLKKANLFECCIVAFIDILGFRDIVKRCETNKELAARIFLALEKLKKKNTENSAFKRISHFSDCLVISYPIANLPDPVSMLLMEVGGFALEFLQLGIAVRGGITIGPLHHSDGIVFGQALIDAYEMENKKADVPRILVDPEIYSVVPKGVEEHNQHLVCQNPALLALISSNAIYNLWLSKDEKGDCFLDFLRESRALVGVSKHHNFMSNLRELIISQLHSEEAFSDPIIKKKWEWFATYYNSTLSRCYAEYCIIPIAISCDQAAVK